jgi:hypothetical protein
LREVGAENSGHRQDRDVAGPLRRRLCQQHLTLLPLGRALVAESNVGLKVLTVSSHVDGDRLQPLHGCLSLYSMARTDLEPRKSRFLGKPPSSLTNSCAPVSLLLRESQQLLRATPM